MNILFVLNQLPFPPRNGVTIPVYNLMAGLSRHHNVSILLLRKEDGPVDTDMFENNKKLVDQLLVSRLHADRNVLTRLISEFMGKEIFHISGRYDTNDLKEITASQSFDVVWISGESILNVTAILKSLMPENVIFIAGLNDSISAPFKQARKFIILGGMRLKDRLINLLKWLRSNRVASIECKILRDFDLLLLQTEEDRMCLNAISDCAFDERILLIPNGVNQDLFDLDIQTRSGDKVILFVGVLWGNYSKVVVWLIEKVWPLVKGSIPDAKFTVTGVGASEQLRSKIAADDSIEYNEFIPDIVDVYRGKSVAILPVFKGFGIINKVIESMASGVPVVGDKSSFNGIDGFVNGTHGIISDNEVKMASSVVELLRNPEKHTEMARQARQLVKNQFRWSDRVDALNLAIENLHADLIDKHTGSSPEDAAR